MPLCLSPKVIVGDSEPETVSGFVPADCVARGRLWMSAPEGFAGPRERHSYRFDTPVTVRDATVVAIPRSVSGGSRCRSCPCWPTPVLALSAML